MPLAAVLLMIDVMFIWHAVKTGRCSPWCYIILALPGVGAAAYILVELLPEWLNSFNGQKAQIRVGRALNPEKQYRALTDALMIADTVANREALAKECLAIEKFAEAKTHFDTILRHPQGDNPAYAFGKARAEFGLGQFAAVIATLDALRTQWPAYQSADAHMLYARALEESGQPDAALAEYQALADYHSGAEARVRMGLLLAEMGRRDEAKAMFAEVIAVMARQPKFVRKVQAEWIGLAEKALRA
jgi:hypothetical protein